MSDKKAELDILAEAHLPEGLLTPTLGSNYGMDGYPDMEYGMGVLSAVLDQDFQEPPALPTGVQKGGAADMDLGSLISEDLADLDWLDPAQLQDPDRLPHNPVDLSIPELVEAWGVNRRTDGVHVAHQQDLGYAKSRIEETKKVIANPRVLERLVTSAMRKSIEGKSAASITREAAGVLGHDMGRVNSLLKPVMEDHGLAGNVFVRASAYPGWGTGKWKDHANKYAKEARYILVSKRDLEQASWIQSGRCVYTGKKAVLEVPWKQALLHYSPRLEALGRKVAGGDPRSALKSALLKKGTQKVAEYKGATFEANSTKVVDMSLGEESSAFAKAASEGGTTVGEVRGLVKVTKRAMSEGLAGKDLDFYLSNRFSNRLLKACSGIIKGERKSHEGLAGFLYVEASAYASESGTKGCDKGALKHRANQIPSVRSMDRCASCSLARRMEDGTMKCGTYNKVLVGSKDLKGPDVEGIREANIKSSNMTDAEVTASMFAPKYDPAEYGLANDNLEGIDTHIPETEKVADIMFGGWEI